MQVRRQRNTTREDAPVDVIANAVGKLSRFLLIPCLKLILWVVEDLLCDGLMEPGLATFFNHLFAAFRLCRCGAVREQAVAVLWVLFKPIKKALSSVVVPFDSWTATSSFGTVRFGACNIRRVSSLACPRLARCWPSDAGPLLFTSDFGHIRRWNDEEMMTGRWWKEPILPTHLRGGVGVSTQCWKMNIKNESPTLAVFHLRLVFESFLTLFSSTFSWKMKLKMKRKMVKNGYCELH